MSTRSKRPIVITEEIITFPADLTEAEKWDKETKGLRLFRFVENAPTSFSNLITGLALATVEALTALTLGLWTRYVYLTWLFLTQLQVWCSKINLPVYCVIVIATQLSFSF